MLRAYLRDALHWMHLLIFKPLTLRAEAQGFGWTQAWGIYLKIMSVGLPVSLGFLAAAGGMYGLSRQGFGWVEAFSALGAGWLMGGLAVGMGKVGLRLVSQFFELTFPVFGLAFPVLGLAFGLLLGLEPGLAETDPGFLVTGTYGYSFGGMALGFLGGLVCGLEGGLEGGLVGLASGLVTGMFVGGLLVGLVLWSGGGRADALDLVLGYGPAFLLV